MHVDTKAEEKLFPSRGDHPAILGQYDMIMGGKRIRDGDTEMTSQMIVTRARHPQIIVSAPAGLVTRWSIDRDRHEAFEHSPDERRCQAVVRMSALLGEHQKPRIDHLGEMTARRLRRNPGRICKLASGQSATVKQRHQNVGASRVPDQRRHL